jgi:UDP-galactopyranose mutase
LKSNRIIPMGRFGEWEYHNMDKAILSGKKAAESLSP